MEATDLDHVQDQAPKFLCFPLELLLLIISQIPSVPYPCTSPAEYVFKMTYQRSRTLLSLSQTCCDLREVFLPLYWESLDIGVGAYAEELELTKAERERRVMREIFAKTDMLEESFERGDELSQRLR
jgi:hypothetical protein